MDDGSRDARARRHGAGDRTDRRSPALGRSRHPLGRSRQGAGLSGRGFIRAGALRPLPTWLAAVAGAEAGPILARAGIRAELPADGLLAFDAGAAVLEEAARASGRDEVAASFARELRWADFGVLGYVVLHAPTLGAALTSLRRYFAIQQTAGAFTVDVDGEHARVRYAMRAPPHEPPRQHALIVLAMLVRLVRDGLGVPGWAPTEVTMPHPPPRRPGDARAVLGVDPRYRADAAGLVLPAALLRQPMVTADPGLFPILVRHAEECLARLPAVDGAAGDTLAEVRRLVASMLGSATLAIDDVAARMGTSARTVQRQLQAHGLTFKQLVDEVRRTLAQRHLADPDVSLTDAAFLLGYSDLSAFSRAFRRWTGESAQAFRRTRLTATPQRGRPVR